MSSDEQFLAALLDAAHAAGLEILIVGSTAAVLQGAPVMTQDVDILIRDTRANREKLERFAKALGARMMRPSDLSTAIKLVDIDIPVDVLFDRLPTGERFEALRSRSKAIALGRHSAVVIALEDVIASKQAAGRDKDRAQLPTLQQTLQVAKQRKSAN
jgi:hypothetical protein